MGYDFSGVAYSKVPLSQVNDRPGKGKSISAIDQNRNAQIPDSFSLTANSRSETAEIPSNFSIKDAKDLTRSIRIADRLGQNDSAISNKLLTNYVSLARKYYLSPTHTKEQEAEFRETTRAMLRYVRHRQSAAAKGIDKVEKEPKSKQNEAVINDFYKEELYVQQALFEAKTLMGRSGDLNDLQGELNETLSDSFALSARIEEVAVKNGYQLYVNNEEAEMLNSYLVNDAVGAATADLSLLSKIQDSMVSVVKEVLAIIVNNNIEHGKLNDESTKQLLLKKQVELKDIDKKLIKKLISKCLMNKLNAEKAELLYLLKDPTRIIDKRLADIKNAISKIKVVLEKAISTSK